MRCDWLLCSSSPFHPPPPYPCLSGVLNACHYSPLVRGKGERREKWRTGQVMRGLRDKSQPDFYLGLAPGAGSSRLLLPSNQEKRDEVCYVAAQIDSRHNLFLSALVQRIVLHRGTRRFSKRLPATFHAIILGIRILTAPPSHYF